MSYQRKYGVEATCECRSAEYLKFNKDKLYTVFDRMVSVSCKIVSPNFAGRMIIKRGTVTMDVRINELRKIGSANATGHAAGC